MHEKRKLVLILGIMMFVIFTLAMSLPSSSASVASSANSRSFTVIVSRYGFNGTMNKFTITVQQGDSVDITFIYGDGDLAGDNPHAMSFEGYGVNTVKIDKSNPTATVKFVADQSGTFIFYCNIPCLGMENLLGHLIVGPGGNGPSATSLALAVDNSNVNSNFFLISATVKNVSGQPLPGVPVRFYENTTFGQLLLVKIPTDTQGVATLNYTSARAGSFQIIAETQGSIAKTVTITMPSRETQLQAEGEAYLGIKLPTRQTGVFYGISYPPNLSMIAVPRLMNITIVIIAGVVVLSVWSIYAYIVRQILRLPKLGALRLTAAEMPFPEPIQDRIGPATQTVNIADKAFRLLFLAPLLGVGNVVLVSNFGIPLIWKPFLLVALAITETAAVLAMRIDQASAK